MFSVCVWEGLSNVVESIIEYFVDYMRILNLVTFIWNFKNDGETCVKPLHRRCEKLFVLVIQLDCIVSVYKDVKHIFEMMKQ